MTCAAAPFQFFRTRAVLSCLALMISSKNVAAQDAPAGPGPYAENSFGTLHFYVPKHGAQLHFELDPDLFDKSTQRRAGKARISTTTSYVDAKFAATFGIADRLRLGVSRVHPLYDEIKSKDVPTGVTTTKRNLTPSAPALSFSWRLLEDRQSGIYLNTSLSVAPPLSKSADPSADLAGSLGRYVWATELDGVRGSHELGLNLAATSYQQGHVTAADAKDSNNTDPYLVLTSSLSYRWHATEQVYLQPTAEINLGHTTKTNYQNRTPVSTVTTKFPSRLIARFAMGYVVSPKMGWNVTISHQDYKRTTTHTVAPRDGSVDKSQTDGALVFNLLI